MRTKIVIEYEVTHAMSEEGILLQVWQYVNGAGDGGFSCLVKDYQDFVHRQTGVGQLSLQLSNMLFDYIKVNKL